MDGSNRLTYGTSVKLNKSSYATRHQEAEEHDITKRIVEEDLFHVQCCLPNKPQSKKVTGADGSIASSGCFVQAWMYQEQPSPQ